jgi:hypothetical protein
MAMSRYHRLEPAHGCGPPLPTPTWDSFALGHPEKFVDIAWRAVHDMTVAAKYIVFKDPNWDWRTFELDRDLDRAEAGGETEAADAMEANLSAFASTRRQTSHVPRLERRARRSAREYQVLRARAVRNGRSGEDSGMDSLVRGSRHGSLSRRRRAEHVRRRRCKPTARKTLL